MTMPRLVLISSATALGGLPQVLERLHQEGPLFEVKTILTHEIQEHLEVETALETICKAQAVLFDLRGNPERAVALMQRAKAQTEGQSIAFIPVFPGDQTILGLLRMGDFSFGRPGAAQGGWSGQRPPASNGGSSPGMPPPFAGGAPGRHAQNWQRCMQYWMNSGPENLANLLRFVAAEYAGAALTAAEPILYPECGFMDIATGERYANFASFEAAHPLDQSRPTVVVLFYGGTGLAANLAGGRELFDALGQRANVLPLFTDGIKTLEALRTHCLDEGRPICDAVVSLLWFRLDGGPMGGDAQRTVDFLKTLDVPYYVASTSYSREIALWEASSDGLPPTETLTTVTFAELDGAIDPVFLYGLVGQSVAPVVGRGEHLAARILKRIALQKKPNAEKRLAVVIFNYPPGEGTLGTASFLDVFASVEKVLTGLKEAGYSVEPPPETLKDLFLNRGLLHNGSFSDLHGTARHALRIPLATYLRWYAQLPHSIRTATESVFGAPPGDLMVDGDDLLVAGIALGNVVVAVQPSRGVHEDPAKIYHDASLPAHHHYLAFYCWLAAREGWDADAVIHVGTHGTLEFLPGKQVALSSACVPDRLMADLPHVYLYHVANVSEGTIARRRSYAQLVSYASPTFAPAGLYGHLSDLEDLLAEYEHQRLSPPRAQTVLRQIARSCAEHDIPLAFSEAELPCESEVDPGVREALDGLHRELFGLKRVAIPIGLHTFGEGLSGEPLVDYLALVARYDRGEAPALPRLLAQERGLDYDQLLDTADTRVEQLADETRAVIRADILPGAPMPLVGEQAQAHQKTSPCDSPGAGARAFLRQVALQVRQSDELGALLHALEGRYVEPGLGGDPVRTPATYPTGRNTYQFDPTKLPTDSACERGARIADATLRRYLAEQGGYPEAVGVILWGFETCNTLGETLGQILHYIGVGVERGQGYFLKPVVIPLEALGRPRIDVTVNICGFFRDLFPHLVRFLDLAFRTVAHLDEPIEQNFIRRHTQAMAGELGAASDGRVFGPPPGEYGNRLSNLIETGAWEEEADLARLYLQRTQYLYGEQVSASPKALAAALSRIRLVSQVRDSHEFEVTDLDHYYEFFGGMAKAAELIGGRRPAVLIADTTKERIEVKTLAEAVRQGVTSRLFNPRWLDGMLRHDHQGAQGIADRVEYLMGLDATTGSVGTTTWHKVAQHFVFDQAMRERLMANNPFAEAEIIRHLAQANGRGYWQATSEERARLDEIYLEIEYRIEAGEMVAPIPQPQLQESR